MEILFLKLNATIFWPRLIALPWNTLPIDGWQFFGGFRALFLIKRDAYEGTSTYLSHVIFLFLE
jgi:hypothetical protein